MFTGLSTGLSTESVNKMLFKIFSTVKKHHQNNKLQILC